MQLTIRSVAPSRTKHGVIRSRQLTSIAIVLKKMTGMLIRSKDKTKFTGAGLNHQKSYVYFEVLQSKMNA